MVRCSVRGQVFGFLLSSFCCGGARLEAEAVIAGFNDMAMMRQPTSPLAEAQVRGDRHAGALIKLGEQVEEQSSAGGAERQIAKLIQDHEIAADQAFGDLACFSQGFFLLERIDQFDGGEEANLFAMMFDRLNAEGRRQMRLSGSGSSDEDDIIGIVDELAAMELSHQRFIELAGGEVESGQILVGGEARHLDLVSDRSDLSFGGFDFQQLGDDGDSRFERRRSLLHVSGAILA